jgi:serine/threonine-protein kinase HipA
VGKVTYEKKRGSNCSQRGKKEGPLNELDYLLGVYDGHRMGGLRFKIDFKGDFLNNNKDLACPPWAHLRNLEYASLQLEREDVDDDPEYLKWLSMLIAPGSSLGGARPKASVLDSANGLWIAKFPSRNDERDIGAWEKVVHTLASNCGVNMAEAKAVRFNSNYHTFLNKRFDRNRNNERVHFASAMTLLGLNDGMGYQEGISYLHLVEFMERHSARPTEDIHQLWRRIVFYILISNTDDHLRNHGFLLTKKGWVLSPAYDVNPEPLKNGLTLNINENENNLSIEIAMEVAELFRLNQKEASDILREARAAVSSWRAVAQSLGISKNEQDSMEIAFRRGRD